MKRMLINATQPEELRVAIVDGQTLYDLDIEVNSREQKKANIYKARVTRVEPSLEACFVDYGAERHGFLPLKEICPAFYKNGADSRGSIKDLINEGQELVVQVEKEERGNKGAALTTYISLAGRYLVLMPTNPKAGGVSRRIEGEDRQAIKDALKELDVPSSMGLIVRTAGVGREAEELRWDFEYLRQLWTAITTAAEERKAPFLIYQESQLIIRALRDYLRSDIGEILIDAEPVYNDAREFMQQVMPHNLRKLKLYDSGTPLFSRYQIESQIESAFARDVNLHSGGSIVVDHTEALISIDINSARATKGSDIEETALNTNLEAADEIGRQLRIRDLGGLVVIDFIDMMENRNQRAVEDRLREALKTDRARTQIGRISRFGLLEMSRQRLRPSLGESSQNVCPRCHGHGFIRSIESLALSVLRLVEEEAMKEFTGEVIAVVPNDVGNFLLNEKRHAVSQIEARHRVPVLVINAPHVDTPNFEIRRIRRQDLRLDGDASYEMANAPEPEIVASNTPEGLKSEQPAVVSVPPPAPAPSPAAKPEPAESKGFLAWLGGLFGGGSAEAEPEPKPAKKKTRSSGKGNQGAQARGPKRDRGGDRRGGQRKKTGSKKKTGRKPQDKAADAGSDNRKSSGPKQDNRQGKQAEGESTGNPRSRRRGRRGGRNRRGKGGQKRDEAATGNSQNANQAQGQASGTETQGKGQRQGGNSNKQKPPAASDNQASTAAPNAPQSTPPKGSDAPPPASAKSSPADTTPNREAKAPEQPKATGSTSSAGGKAGAGTESSQSKATPAPSPSQPPAARSDASPTPSKAAPAAAAKPAESPPSGGNTAGKPDAAKSAPKPAAPSQSAQAPSNGAGAATTPKPPAANASPPAAAPKPAPAHPAAASSGPAAPKPAAPSKSDGSPSKDSGPSGD
ncbi:MAG: Rne/Rng family ribonuclease [Pseudomonadota bacterium]